MVPPHVMEDIFGKEPQPGDNILIMMNNVREGKLLKFILSIESILKTYFSTKYIIYTPRLEGRCKI